MNNPPIVMTKKFRRSYRKASPTLQRLIEKETHELVRLMRTSPADIRRNYDKVEGFKPTVKLLEVKVSGADRMVANVESGTIHLLDVGGHDTIPHYTPGKYQTDKHQREVAFDVFWPESPRTEFSFFTRNPCKSFAEIAAETDPSWLYFLSSQQEEVRNEILEQVISSDGTIDARRPVFIVGGPGTGKTSVLINLLKEIVDFEFKARMLCSARMKAFIRAALPDINDNLLVTSSEEISFEEIDLLFIDDPDTSFEITDNLHKWLSMGARFQVVIGFDPCQLSGFDSTRRTSGLDDATFDRLVEITNANVFGLDECYRQKEIVGRATQKAIVRLAESSPFLRQDKIEQFHAEHEGVNSLGHDLTFPNPFGHAEVYEAWSADDLLKEIDRIQSRKCWTHWPSTLIVVDDALNQDLAKVKVLFSSRGIQCEVVLLGNVRDVKGLEYQHLLLFISRNTFDDLENGFHGKGQSEYSKYRLMRIPLSRPKDSLVTFVGPLISAIAP